MSHRVVLRAAAKGELQEAYAWYERQATGLGADFIRSVDACFQLMRRHPEIFPVGYKQLRQGVVRRFPYSVFYLITGDRVIVVSVFHASRNPKIWQRRA